MDNFIFQRDKMKKYLLALLLILSYNYCNANIFGITDSIFKKETNNIKTDLSLIKNAQLSVNAEVGTLKSSMRDLNLKIGQMNAELNTKMVGLDNSVNSTIKSGRDTNTSTTNDSALMKFIFDKIIYVIGLIIGLIGTLIASYERLLKQKDRWIADVEKRNSDKQDKLDSWQNGLLEKLITIDKKT